MNLKARFRIIRDILANFFLRRNLRLVYIVESIDWSIYWDGRYLTENLTRDHHLNSALSTTGLCLKNTLIHYGSINAFMGDLVERLHTSNTIILTWFHIAPEMPLETILPRIEKYVSLIHTSCAITAKKLTDLGVDPKKIIIIPLGVDTTLFQPLAQEKRTLLRKQLFLPEDRIIIGSFQKDGNGWGEGLTPKLIKGPDIFCEVVATLANKYPLHVLLTGPARGYVKDRLTELGIPYTHRFLTDYRSIVPYYQALDLYLITSREEGGPKSLLESMSCAVPVISTPVGMAPEILTDSLAICLALPNDANDIADKASALLSHAETRTRAIGFGRQKIIRYDWHEIAHSYYSNLYRQFFRP